MESEECAGVAARGVCRTLCSGSQGVPGLGDEKEASADVKLSVYDPDAQVLQALVFLGDPFTAEADDSSGQDPQGEYR